MSTLVLVGDSVFDNASYVNGPDVRAQIETKMPDDWAVSLLAVDGSTSSMFRTNWNSCRTMHRY